MLLPCAHDDAVFLNLYAVPLVLVHSVFLLCITFFYSQSALATPYSQDHLLSNYIISSHAHISDLPLHSTLTSLHCPTVPPTAATLATISCLTCLIIYYLLNFIFFKTRHVISEIELIKYGRLLFAFLVFGGSADKWALWASDII